MGYAVLITGAQSQFSQIPDILRNEFPKCVQVDNTCNTEQAFVQLLQAITMQEWEQRFSEKLGINYVYTF